MRGGHPDDVNKEGHREDRATTADEAQNETDN
jgi:hypothetical protein